MLYFKKFKNTVFVGAQYYLLQPIGNYLPNGNGPAPDLTTYLNQMFKLGLAIAVGLAVIKVVLGGIKYMTSDSISAKGEGKEEIKMALLGLLLALGSWVILNTINPQVLTLNISGGQ